MMTPAMDVEVGPVSQTDSIFRYGAFQLFGPFDPDNLALVPTSSWGKLIRCKMLVQDNSENTGLHFKLSTMTGNQKFVQNDTNVLSNYSPIFASNDLLDFPSTPTVFNLMFSEISDPSNSDAGFVEIYNAGDYSVDFSLYPWYLTLYDGSYHSLQLTGTLDAGATHVIGGSSFSTAYPGKTADQTFNYVENSGMDSCFLSFLNAYNNGILIDLYDGSTAAYTGKHAVRPYVIDSPSTVFSSSDWNITPATNMDMTPGSHHATLDWDGSSDDNWRDTSNWTPPYVPDVLAYELL